MLLSTNAYIEKVSSISWLENHVFLTVHTPSTFDESMAPSSLFHIVTRTPPSSFTFQKIGDPAAPFGLNRSPPHHFLLRLKDFPPNLQDLIIVASTAATDIGLFTRSKTPLVSDKPAEKISGVFTMTEMANDSRRAQLSMTEDMSDTSPIGMVIDLSSKETVVKPIPGDEMDESPTPLPALMVLNNEGVLAAWWVVYTESIRQKMAYPGLVAAGNSAQQTQLAIQPSQPAFGQSAFGAASPSTTFGGLSKAPVSGFGSPGLGSKTASVFGSPSAFGKAASPWGAAATSTPSQNTASAFGTPAFGTPATSTAPAQTAPAFGAPAFGSASTPSGGAAFGSAGLPGNRSSPWGSASNTGSATAFGQPSGLGSKATPFGSTSNAPASGAATIPTSGGGFASFANQGGFAAAAPQSSGSIFGTKPADANPFAKPTSSTGMDTDTAFGAPRNDAEKPANPFGSTPFTLGSTFKGDGTSKDDAPKPTSTSGNSFFGGGFTLGEATKSSDAVTPITKEANMDDMVDSTAEAPKIAEAQNTESTTPSATPAASKFQFKTDTAPGTGSTSLFGVPSSKTDVPATTKPTNASAAFSFSKSAEAPQPPPKSAEAPVSPQIKSEPKAEEEFAKLKEVVPEAPSPAEPRSKVSFADAESTKPAEPEAPLPPDFMPKSNLKQTQDSSAKSAIDPSLIPPSDVPGGPEEDGDEEGFETDESEEEGEAQEDDDSGSDEDENDFSGFSEEGSGEDVTKDLSPTSEAAETPAFTPQASFGGDQASPVGGLFSKLSRPKQANAPAPLFGEIGNTPVLPPPKSQESPRSPSPVRSALPGRLRQENMRSVSAPGAASQLLGNNRKQAPPGTGMASAIEEKKEEERRKADARAKKELEEAQALVDQEDEKVQAFLKSNIIGNKTLDEFIAHQDYVGNADKDSIPAQVEMVYRDINSMIDTLGLNARALASFIKGHTEQFKKEGRGREDLAEDDEWCLGEIESLSSIIENDLTQKLEEGRVKDVPGKLDTCLELQREQNKLRIKHEDMRRTLAQETDPEHLASSRAQPLSAEQLAQQHELRKEFANVQKLLAEAEEGLTLLKTKLVSQANGKGKGGQGVPTVEAVMRTVMKMTSMVEKRSGDVDMLENQMRKLRMESVSSIPSREGSPFETPSKSNPRRSLGGSTFGFSYGPETPRESPRRFNASMASSTRSVRHATPPRRNVSGFSAGEKEQLRAQAWKRREVAQKLKGALKKCGPRVRSMEE
jgi:nucleoporin NUP159